MNQYHLSASTMPELIPKIAQKACDLGARGFVVTHVALKEYGVNSPGQESPRYSSVECWIFYQIDSRSQQRADGLAPVISIEDVAVL